VTSDPATSPKDQVRATFDRLAHAYDAAGPGCFAHFGRRLVDVVGLEPRNVVLDVATGRGAVLFPALDRVGPTGKVLGIDLSEGMVRETNAEAERRGLTPPAQVMDAEELEFSDRSFDRVLCGFGIMFFPARGRALAEFRRVLRAGGRVGLSTWQRTQAQDMGDVLRAASLAPEREPGWIADVDQLRHILVEAGFRNVQVIADEATFHFADIDEYWQVARATGLGRVLSTLTDDQLERVRNELTDRLNPYAADDGLRVPATALLGVGAR